MFSFLIFSPSAGPIVGGAFASYDWRFLFYINLIITPPLIVSSFFCIKLKTPEGSIREKMKKMDWCARPFSLPSLFPAPRVLHVSQKVRTDASRRIGNFLFIPSISVLILGLVSGGASHPWKSAFVIATIIAGVIGLVAWVFHQLWLERTQKHPTVPFAALWNRTTVIGYATNWLHGIIAMVLLYFCTGFPSSTFLDGES
jgi:hypothetical protein